MDAASAMQVTAKGTLSLENSNEALCGRAQVDIYFHHCIPTLFESLLFDKIRYHDSALVMPFANE